MAQKDFCCRDYDLKEVAQEALSLAGFPQIKIFQVENIGGLGEFRSEQLSDGSRFRIFCICWNGKCDVDIFRSNGKKVHEWRIGIKDDRTEGQRHFMVWKPSKILARSGVRPL